MIIALLALAALGIFAAVLWATRVRVQRALTDEEQWALWATNDERKGR